MSRSSITAQSLNTITQIGAATGASNQYYSRIDNEGNQVATVWRQVIGTNRLLVSFTENILTTPFIYDTILTQNFAATDASVELDTDEATAPEEPETEDTVTPEAPIAPDTPEEPGDDNLVGEQTDDTLTGSDGEDTITDDDGEDTATGDDGDDMIIDSGVDETEAEEPTATVSEDWWNDTFVFLTELTSSGDSNPAAQQDDLPDWLGWFDIGNFNPFSGFDVSIACNEQTANDESTEVAMVEDSTTQFEWDCMFA